MKYAGPGAWLAVMAVAPYTGAWIEIIHKSSVFAPCAVAPYTGAWIEMTSYICFQKGKDGRSLHGSVD